jgi:CRP-like cAMP-binding protein
MRNTNLDKLWKEYHANNFFNYSSVKSFVDVNGIKFTLEKGAMVVEEGNTPEFVYFIVKGVVVGRRTYKDGNEFRYFEADNQIGNIGLLEVLACKNKYVASVECLTDVSLIKVPASMIYAKIMENPILLRKCVSLLANDLYQTSSKEGRLYRLSGINRARLFLAEFYKNSKENKVTVKKKQKELAAELGVSVRTVDRVIRSLSLKGEITYRDRKIVLLPENYEKILSNLEDNDI